MNSDEQLELNLEHARASYANAQEVIRFVDTKTGIMTGIVTITTGLPFALLNLLISSDTPAATSLLEWYFSCGFGIKFAITSLGVGGILFGVFSLLASTSGLKSRAPSSKQARESIIVDMFRFLWFKIKRRKASEAAPTSPQALTCLFPYHGPETAKAAKQNFDRLSEGKYALPDIIAEYGNQLLSVGGILHTKIQRNRDAVHWFEWQVAAYFFAGALAAFIFNVCPMGKKESPTSAKDTAVVAAPTVAPNGGNAPQQKQPTSTNPPVKKPQTPPQQP